MGTYATTTSLQTVMIGTTFDSATTSLASKCITWAENEVNKYLSKRYDISSSTFQTTTSIPPIVTDWTEQIAEGRLHQKMSRGGPESLERGQKIIDSVIDNLELIADYKGHLLDSSGSIITDKSNTSYRVLENTSDYATTFDEDSPLDWEVDPDKIDDISDGRI